MFEFLKSYKGTIYVNDVKYSVDNLPDFEQTCGKLTIRLVPDRLTESDSYIILDEWIASDSPRARAFHGRWNKSCVLRTSEGFGAILDETLQLYRIKIENNGIVWVGYIPKSTLISIKKDDKSKFISKSSKDSY